MGNLWSECLARTKIHDGRDHHLCLHPNVSIARRAVTPEICRLCSHKDTAGEVSLLPAPTRQGHWRQGVCQFLGEALGEATYGCNHPLHSSTTIPECKSCFDFEAPLHSVRNWSVGVTTAPRKEPTLARCLSTLAAAGWPECIVFAEPDSDLRGLPEGTELVTRNRTLGAWPNWLLGLSEMFLRDPRADAYFIVQDDTIFCQQIRELLEAVLWPDPATGLVSVYSAAPCCHNEVGFHRVKSEMLGALSVILPNVSVRLLLADFHVVSHRMSPMHDGTKYIDVVVGDWCGRSRRPAYFFSPSLAQHIGDHSTLWKGDSGNRRRSAADFVGTDFDATALISDSHT